MGKVFIALSISADGFIAGPNDGSEHPLGEGGERLFEWFAPDPQTVRENEWFAPPEASKPVVESWRNDCGAIVSGRRTFDNADGWKHGHPFDVPIFVVTHEPPTEGEWSPRISFVTEGVERAVELAQAEAGDRDVSLCAANVVQQALRAGILDEIELNVVPCLLGSGVRLFDNLGSQPVALEQTRVIPSDGVTHVRYRVSR